MFRIVNLDQVEFMFQEKTTNISLFLKTCNATGMLWDVYKKHQGFSIKSEYSCTDGKRCAIFVRFRTTSAAYNRNIVAAIMGDGTFFKVEGQKCTSKNIYKIFAVWIGNCDVTNIEIWRHYLYTYVKV